MNIIAPLITCFEVGFHMYIWSMSIFLTVVGSWIRNRQMSMEPIRMFFYKWPRNISITFMVETFIAQPVARMAMLKMHQNKDINCLLDQ